MKDKRVIKIKDPRLRKIRNEFRLLWLAATSSEWNQISDKMEKIGSDDKGKALSVNEMKEKGVLGRFRFLQNERSELDEKVKLSICQCATCGRADLDMYYNKAYNAWWCVECVGMFRVMHPQMKEKYADKDPRFFDFDEGFGESFL